MVYLDDPETPDTVESAFLDLDEREAGITGAVGGSSTCVLGRFWKLKPHPAAGLSGSGLAGRGERLVLENFGSVGNFTPNECEVNDLLRRRRSEGNKTRRRLGNHGHWRRLHWWSIKAR